MKELNLQEYCKKHGCLHLIEGKQWARGLKLVLNTRLRRALGRACYGRKTIELSGRILMESDEHIRETLVHELCHFIAFHEHKELGHGPAFQMLMRKHYNPNHKGRFHTQELTTEYRYVAELGKRAIVKKKPKAQPAAPAIVTKRGQLSFDF